MKNSLSRTAIFHLRFIFNVLFLEAMSRNCNTFVVVDVQSGATGNRCLDRFPMRVQAIKLVREGPSDWGQFDEKREISTFISGLNPLSPKIEFKSTLTPITGITREEYKHGAKQTLDVLTARLIKYISADATVVCQADWNTAQQFLTRLG
jgi:hypothetical protein